MLSFDWDFCSLVRDAQRTHFGSLLPVFKQEHIKLLPLFLILHNGFFRYWRVNGRRVLSLSDCTLRTTLYSIRPFLQDVTCRWCVMSHRVSQSQFKYWQGGFDRSTFINKFQTTPSLCALKFKHIGNVLTYYTVSEDSWAKFASSAELGHLQGRVTKWVSVVSKLQPLE